MLLQRENDLQNKQKQTLLDIRSCLEDSKAFNIVEIDLSGKTEQADFMLIATGSSKVQISAISQKVISLLKDKKISSYCLENAPIFLSEMSQIYLA